MHGVGRRSFNFGAVVDNPSVGRSVTADLSHCGLIAGCLVALFIYKFLNLFLLDPDVPAKATVASLYSCAGRSCKLRLENCGFSLPPLLVDSDRFVWRQDSSGAFSVASAWNAIRASKAKAPWTSFVWDKDLAPRFQFLLWLITKNRLPTQSLLLSYGRIDYLVCTFCNT